MGSQQSEFPKKMRRAAAASQGRAGASRMGGYGRHIIKVVIRDGREYQLHATKGWRSRRA